MTESGATEINDDGTRSTLRAALTSVARDAGSSIGAVHPDMPSAESHVTNQCSLLSTRVSLSAPALVHSTTERPQKHTQCEARLFVCVNGLDQCVFNCERLLRGIKFNLFRVKTVLLLSFGSLNL